MHGDLNLILTLTGGLAAALVFAYVTHDRDVQRAGRGHCLHSGRLQVPDHLPGRDWRQQRVADSFGISGRKSKGVVSWSGFSLHDDSLAKDIIPEAAGQPVCGVLKCRPEAKLAIQDLAEVQKKDREPRVRDNAAQALVKLSGE
jgi:hypothetical protein